MRPSSVCVAPQYNRIMFKAVLSEAAGSPLQCSCRAASRTGGLSMRLFLRIVGGGFFAIGRWRTMDFDETTVG
jgi:hypothetical protein